METLKENRESDLSQVIELIKGRAASGPFVPDSRKLGVSNSETASQSRRNSVMQPHLLASSPGKYSLQRNPSCENIKISFKHGNDSAVYKLVRDIKSIINWFNILKAHRNTGTFKYGLISPGPLAIYTDKNWFFFQAHSQKSFFKCLNFCRRQKVTFLFITKFEES